MSSTDSEKSNEEVSRIDFGEMFETGQFADASVICFETAENGVRKRVPIPVHRAILAARSKVFAAGFANGVNQLEIHEDFPPSVVRMMLSFVYSGKSPSEIDNNQHILLYKAAKIYGLDMFKEELVEVEILINDFPTKQNPGPKVFSDFYDIWWDAFIKLAMRKKQKSDGTMGPKQIHMDFKLKNCFQRLITDLSLSVVNSAGEKLKTVKQAKGLFHGKGTTIWKDCFDYNQIVNFGKKKINHKRWVKRGAVATPKLPRELVVLCEATFISLDELDDLDKVQFEKLLDEGTFSDARIVFPSENGGKEVVFPVHKAILAVGSKVFAAAFSGGMREAETGEMVVAPEQGFSPETIRAMLHFVYTSKIPLKVGTNSTALFNLFKAAHFYQIDKLISACVQLFHLTVRDCTKFLLIADAQNCRLLMVRVLDFLRENEEAVKSSWGWRRLMKSDKTALKALCGHWLGDTPVSVENYTELLQLYDIYGGNWRLVQRALDFVHENLDEIAVSEGWRRLMESQPGWDPANDPVDFDPKAFYAHYLWKVPLSAECCVDLFRLGDAYDDVRLREIGLEFADAKRRFKSFSTEKCLEWAMMSIIYTSRKRKQLSNE